MLRCDHNVSRPSSLVRGLDNPEENIQHWFHEQKLSVRECSFATQLNLCINLYWLQLMIPTANSGNHNDKSVCCIGIDGKSSLFLALVVVLISYLLNSSFPLPMAIRQKKSCHWAAQNAKTYTNKMPILNGHHSGASPRAVVSFGGKRSYINSNTAVRSGPARSSTGHKHEPLW